MMLGTGKVGGLGDVPPGKFTFLEPQKRCFRHSDRIFALL